MSGMKLLFPASKARLNFGHFSFDPRGVAERSPGVEDPGDKGISIQSTPEGVPELSGLNTNNQTTLPG